MPPSAIQSIVMESGINHKTQLVKSENKAQAGCDEALIEWMTSMTCRKKTKKKALFGEERPQNKITYSP